MNTTVLNKMSHLKLHGMLRTYQSMLDNPQHHDLTHDELINMLIQSEWEDRENKKITPRPIAHPRLPSYNPYSSATGSAPAAGNKTYPFAPHLCLCASAI